MINKKEIKRKLKKVQYVKTWQLVVLFCISLVVSATFLRLNNIGMVERRSAVLNADREQDETKIRNRLYELQRYVSSHMNTYMGKGIYLETSYQTAVSNAYDEALDTSTTNIYKAAQDVCAPKFSYWSKTYVNCVAQELDKYPEGQNLTSSIVKPSPDSYLHVFVSPFWSSDFAGWSVMLSVVILLMITIRIISFLILILLLKIRHHNA